MRVRNHIQNYHKIIFPAEIKKYLNEIKELYDNIHQYCFTIFTFPSEDFNDIIERYEKINNSLNPENSNNLKEYKSLSKPILKFAQKIKKTYENDTLNDIFDKLKELNNKIIDYKNIIDGEIIYNSISEEITPPIEFTENEQEHIKSNECSYIKQIESFCDKKIEDRKFRISLACNICSNEANYICYNHCYIYFCDSCMENGQNNKQHNFKKINEKKEKEKLECINYIFHIVKSYVEIADKLFKLNKDNIEYPILKKLNEIDSQFIFLSEIDNLLNKNYNSIDLSIKQIICSPLKKMLREIFGLKESSTGFKPNENDFLSSAENISIFDDNGELKKGVKCVNEIKDIIDNYGNKYITEENINFIQKEYKNLIHRSDESKIFRSLRANVNELKNNKDYKEIKEDMKNIFRGLFKK